MAQSKAQIGSQGNIKLQLLTWRVKWKERWHSEKRGGLLEEERGRRPNQSIETLVLVSWRIGDNAGPYLHDLEGRMYQAMELFGWEVDKKSDYLW